MENYIKQILEKANRSCDSDNRSSITRSINKCIDNGYLKIAIQEQGRIWTNPKIKNEDGSLFKFNIEVKGFGRKYVNYFGGKISENEILRFVGVILNENKVYIGEQFTQGCECSRCNGKGIIQAFNYYCEGICFECYGSGRSIEKVSI